MSAQADIGGKVSGNREVSRLLVRHPRGDLGAAPVPTPDEEEGSRGKHGFPRGSEPKESDG